MGRQKINLLVNALFSLALTAQVLSAATWEVGPGKTYSRIEDAYAAASPGDSILVYPNAGNAAYSQVAIYGTKKRVVIQGQLSGGQRVLLSGQGYEYSGSGSTPRAMFQFNLGTDSCIVENFTVEACTNSSYNGAGFRINQANDIVIRNCEIYHNDMGIMSNGSVGANSASGQLIENCLIHDNGNNGDPGYNHNLYLGGTSVTVRGCNIYNATTGHNLKSRAHQTFWWKAVLSTTAPTGSWTWWMMSKIRPLPKAMRSSRVV